MRFRLPPLVTAADAVAAIAAVADGVAKGRLDADEARVLVTMIEAFVKAKNVLDLEDRVTKLEEAAG
ncbi:hypothetical protein CH340_05135 [Rhodoplanes serenus]|nr:hypothetical protein CH340_05135 [Rhodoplanes serenus]